MTLAFTLWHMDVAEFAWLAVSLVGLVLAVAGGRDAVADLELVESRPRDVAPRELELELGLARADVAGARWVAAFELICVAAGLLAASIPGPPDGRTPQSWVLICLLIMAAAAVPMRTLGQRRRRRALLRGRRAGDD